MKPNHLILKSTLFPILFASVVAATATSESQYIAAADEMQGTPSQETGNVTSGGKNMSPDGIARQEVTSPKQAEFDQHHAAFFAKYPMPREKRELINSALETELASIMAQTRQRGLDRDVRIALQAEERKERFASALRGPLGDNVFEALLAYLDTLELRELANDIAMAVEASGSSLNNDQIDSLVKVFEKNNFLYASVRSRAASPSLNQAVILSFVEKENNILSDIENIVTKQQREVIRQFWFGFTQGQPTREQARFAQEHKDFFLRHQLNKGQQDIIRVALRNHAQFFRTNQGRNDGARSRDFLDKRQRVFRDELSLHFDSKVVDAIVHYINTFREQKLANDIARNIREADGEINSEKIDLLAEVFKKNRVIYFLARSKSAGFPMRPFRAMQTNVMMEAGKILSRPQMDVLEKYWHQMIARPAERNGADRAAGT